MEAGGESGGGGFFYDFFSFFECFEVPSGKLKGEEAQQSLGITRALLLSLHPLRL